MKRFWLLSLVFAASCAVPITPPVPPAPPIVDTFNVAAVVTDAFSHQPIAGASCTVTEQTLRTNGDGYALLLHILGGPKVEQTLGCAKEGYLPAGKTFINDHDQNVAIVLEAEHVDPSGIPLEQLAAIRGAMWPNAGFAGLPYGPRPGDSTNIIATASWNCYSAAQRDQIASELHRRGYTHVVYGPMGVPGQDSYHGQYCAPVSDWNAFLDDAQDLWDRGFTPVVFIHPDNWTYEQTHDYFDPLLRQPRAQRLIRIVVITGWEPAGYTWSSYTWAAYFAWAHDALPNALSLMHNADKQDGSPYDAPVGTDTLYDDNGHPNGEGWQRVFAAGLDGWLIQTGPDTTSPADAPPQHVREWCAMFATDGDGAMFHSIAWHFANGISGFPTTTLRGRRFLLYAGEVTAYEGYWRNLPAADRDAWGDLAMRCGGDGYLDGGRVPVPPR